jgi:hypothetical protein
MGAVEVLGMICKVRKVGVMTDLVSGLLAVALFLFFGRRGWEPPSKRRF